MASRNAVGPVRVDSAIRTAKGASIEKTIRDVTAWMPISDQPEVKY